METISPTLISLHSTLSSLCSVALLIVVPATLTGSNTALGVTCPVLPTSQGCLHSAEPRHSVLPVQSTLPFHPR